MKRYHTRLLSLRIGCLLTMYAVGGMCAPANVGAITTNFYHTAQAANPAPLADASANLDAKRLYALGMIETGNDDQAVGLAGEISRYQLSPSVWKCYSRSVSYQNPQVAIEVARQHWKYLAAYFAEKTGRAPTDFDMYVLWNTRFGYYAHREFSKRQLAWVVKERAQRFVNLVNRKMG